jgi:hypothetical protein
VRLGEIDRVDGHRAGQSRRECQRQQQKVFHSLYYWNSRS